jgi:intein/homing endonuclease
MIHTTEESIYKLFIENDILEVTGIHRFYIQRNNQNEWIAAANLNINDKVLFANGIWHKINNI